MYAICTLSIVPVRKDPSDRSEMVSQLLFGELAEVMDKQDSWRKVKMLHDNYTGWVDKKQITAIADEDVSSLNDQPVTVTLDIVQLAVWGQHQILPILLGSSLPAYRNKTFSIGKISYQFDGSIQTL